MTASAEYEKKESKTGSTPPRHETPLHTAALHGHADQIPKEFLTLEFLSIEAKGYRHTVLECLFMSNSLGVIPGIYSNSKMLDYKNSRGWTLRQSIECKEQSAAAVARVRSKPATDKQIEKFRYFGCAFGKKSQKGKPVMRLTNVRSNSHKKMQIITTVPQPKNNWQSFDLAIKL